MKTLKVMAAALTLAFGLAACGGGAPDTDALADDFVDLMADQAGEQEGMEDIAFEDFIDKDCLVDRLDELSDDDLKKIEDGLAEFEDDPDAKPDSLSDKGEEVMSEGMTECFDTEGLQKKVLEEQGAQ